MYKESRLLRKPVFPLANLAIASLWIPFTLVMDEFTGLGPRGRVGMLTYFLIVSPTKCTGWYLGRRL